MTGSRVLPGFLLPTPEGEMTRWEYQDRMVMFKETSEGLISNLEWLPAAGAEGWEVAVAVPLIAPNRDGVAYGTVGALFILRRPAAA